MSQKSGGGNIYLLDVSQTCQVLISTHTIDQCGYFIGHWTNHFYFPCTAQASFQVPVPCMLAPDILTSLNKHFPALAWRKNTVFLKTAQICYQCIQVITDTQSHHRSSCLSLTHNGHTKRLLIHACILTFNAFYF